MALYFLGSFPPPFGGVTVKNENLLRALDVGPHPPTVVNFSLIKKGNVREAWRFLLALLSRKSTWIVGVAGRRNRKWLIRLLYLVNRLAMRRSILILMGGVAADDIVSDPLLAKCCKEFRSVFCEADGMISKLSEKGISAAYYPNGRFRPQAFSVAQPSIVASSDGKLKAVFFSLINSKKGCDQILQAAAHLPEVSFTFYGPIDKQYEAFFLGQVKNLSNVEYKGIFTGKGDAVYQELSQYDVVLLPTHYLTEGVPGILVEGKIAGLAEIVSGVAYNAEIVEDQVSGIVLRDTSAECLAQALQKLTEDPKLLASMKENSHKSAEHYYIENYVQDILSAIAP